MLLQTFTRPPVEIPETGLPVSIEHGCDYDFNDRGGIEYRYNFLYYRWLIDGREVFSRSYLDDVNKVAVMLAYAEFDQPAYLPMLSYLQRRFNVIETFEGAGYAKRWQLKIKGKR
jgi:hypothetical protein